MTRRSCAISSAATPRLATAALRLETGELSAAEFETKFARLLGLREDRAQGLIDRLFGGMKEDIVMFAAVRSAKAQGIATGLLSNSWGVDRYDRALPAALRRRRDQRRGRRAQARSLDLRPRAPAHGDAGERDRLRRRPPGNLKPARELGMSTVHHTSGGETVTQLEAMLGVRLR